MPEVSVITVQAQSLDLSTELYGRVAASLTAEVRPQVSGILLNRLFTEGANVKAGDVLYEINPASYQAAYQAAQASLARAEASLTPIQLKAERYAELRKTDSVSIQDYDDAMANMRLVQAEIAAAKASVASAKINLDFCKITAPISGRIGRSAVTTGALVTANQTSPLATILQLNPVFVDVTQSTTELLRFKDSIKKQAVAADAAAANVSLHLPDGSKYGELGTLKFSEAFVDENTSSVVLRTLFPNPELTLLPGMFVKTYLSEGTRKEAIVIPQRTVSRNPAGQATVMTVDDKQIATPRVIETERTVGNAWLIASGLKPGDRIIVEGLQKAPPGTMVTTVPFEVKPSAPASKK